jgi:hypothetical protein
MIDIKLEECLSNDQENSMISIINCVSQAAYSWSLLLDEKILELNKLLNKKRKNEFKRVQKKWEEHINAEYHFSSTLTIEYDGSDQKLANVEDRINTIKRRISDIENYIDRINSFVRD